jgi:hypothetical protein
MQATRPALDRNQLGRYLAALFGAVALVCFYQPWVAGTLPVVGESTLTGLDLAKGEASERVDQAAFGKSATSPGAPTTVSGAASGGLTLPTRVPTVAAGTGTLGGLTLPTRVPTVAAGGSTGFSAGAAATAASASGTSGGPAPSTPVPTVAPAAASTAPDVPEHLPQVLLYGVPLAAAGIATFSLIWDRLQDPRDRLYGKWWTVLLSCGGALGVGYVLFKVSTAPGGNDLLAPGAVKSALWGLWGAFIAFLLSALSLAAAWTARGRPRAAQTPTP